MKSIEEIVKRKLTEQKKQQKEFYEEVGITKQQLHSIFNKNSTSIQTLEKIAFVLGIRVSDFFEDEYKFQAPKGYKIIEESELLRLKEVEVKYLTDKLEEQKKNAD